jgi:hypothetical protein
MAYLFVITRKSYNYIGNSQDVWVNDKKNGPENRSHFKHFFLMYIISLT